MLCLGDIGFGVYCVRDSLKTCSCVLSAFAAFLLLGLPQAIGAENSQKDAQTGFDASSLPLPHAETIESNAFDQRCKSDVMRPSIHVHIDGFKDTKGKVRVQLYGEDPERFLAKGAKLLRIEVAVPDEGGPVDLCVPLEQKGVYALFVMHDRNENGKANVFSDGFGISNNPKMKLRKPRHDEAAFEVGDEVLDMDIELQYFGGNKKKRRGR